MKKILFILCFIVASLGASAQGTQRLRAVSYSYQLQDDNGNWLDWTDWETSNVPITVDPVAQQVTIFTPDLQKYNLYEFLGDNYDVDGLETVSWRFKDQDADEGILRFVERPSGNLEIYIDFANMRWVYRVIGD